MIQTVNEFTLCGIWQSSVIASHDTKASEYTKPEGQDVLIVCSLEVTLPHVDQKIRDTKVPASRSNLQCYCHLLWCMPKRRHISNN